MEKLLDCIRNNLMHKKCSKKQVHMTTFILKKCLCT